MARRTSNEVIAELERLYETDGPAYEHAAQLVRDNLIPQWQDEPTEEGEYHVRGIAGICSVGIAAGVWKFRRLTSSTGSPLVGEDGNWNPLNGRQVCPIGARPQ